MSAFPYNLLPTICASSLRAKSGSLPRLIRLQREPHTTEPDGLQATPPAPVDFAPTGSHGDVFAVAEGRDPPVPTADGNSITRSPDIRELLPDQQFDA